MKHFRGAVLILFFMAVFALAMPAFAAHTPLVADGSDIEAELSSLGLRLVLMTLAGVFVLLLASMAIHKPTELLKRSLFWGITIAVVTTTFVLIFFSVTLNTNSWSKGPIHWHADYQVYACGQQLDLVDPVGLGNKIGTPSRHEHNDNRLHYEGVVLSSGNAKLGSFMEVLGAELTNDSLVFPTNTETVHYHTGDTCSDGTVGEVQVFLYRVGAGNVYTQTKLEHPEDYIIRSESAVPPGDCLVIEFGAPKEMTDHICRSYEVADQIGKIRKATQ
ncbi:MAG TPA: hypothetical protein VGE59_03100 [Patescibacteria group bacterium]